MDLVFSKLKLSLAKLSLSFYYNLLSNSHYGNYLALIRYHYIWPHYVVHIHFFLPTVWPPVPQEKKLSCYSLIFFRSSNIGIVQMMGIGVAEGHSRAAFVKHKLRVFIYIVNIIEGGKKSILIREFCLITPYLTTNPANNFRENPAKCHVR